jgi:hypothetical protein
MARKKKTTMEENNLIEPVSVEQIIVTTQQEIEVPYGYVLLVALNTDGTEKPASEFFYPEKSYRKYYGDETKFKVKTKNEITENPPYYENLNRTSQQIIQTITGRCGSCGR